MRAPKATLKESGDERTGQFFSKKWKLPFRQDIVTYQRDLMSLLTLLNWLTSHYEEKVQEVAFNATNECVYLLSEQKRSNHLHQCLFLLFSFRSSSFDQFSKGKALTSLRSPSTLIQSLVSVLTVVLHDEYPIPFLLCFFLIP